MVDSREPSRAESAPRHSGEPRRGWFDRLRSRFGSVGDHTLPLNLALQGGGAHGAFTWGVLDALLEDGRWRFAAVSGASAGAMNAAVLAHGLAGSDDPVASRESAREALHRFWTSVGRAMPYEWLTQGHGGDTRLNPLGRWVVQWTQALSPRQINPLDINPLRDTLTEVVDFERLRRASPVRLLISTTHANSGRMHLHTEREISLDVLLASACLPTLHHAVMLEGEPHWDGGYSANPPILPLVFDDASAADTLLVPLVPMRWTETPTELPQIRQRLAELTFNSRFLAELGTLAQWQDDLRWPRRGRHERMLARAHWHIVDGASALEAMATETRLIAHAPFLEHLRDLGRERAKAWIADHAGAVGRRSSVDLLSLLGARD